MLLDDSLHRLTDIKTLQEAMENKAEWEAQAPLVKQKRYVRRFFPREFQAFHWGFFHLWFFSQRTVFRRTGAGITWFYVTRERHHRIVGEYFFGNYRAVYKVTKHCSKIGVYVNLLFGKVKKTPSFFCKFSPKYFPRNLWMPQKKKFSFFPHKFFCLDYVVPKWQIWK